MSLYVQFGSGWSAPEGWPSFDASPTLFFERLPLVGKVYTRNTSRFSGRVEYGDIVRGLIFADNFVVGAFASHVLEHTPRQSAVQALRDAIRMLKPGVVFRAIVPDLLWRTAEYVKKNRSRACANNPFMDSITMGQRESAGRLIGSLGNRGLLWMYNGPAMTALLKPASSPFANVTFTKATIPCSDPSKIGIVSTLETATKKFVSKPASQFKRYPNDGEE
jgi:hypothetical protein